MGSHNNGTVSGINLENYFVRDDGIIWSIRKSKFLSPWKNNKGYQCVRFNGSQKTVHRIIAETFIPNLNSKPTVNHKNGNRTDNRVENLEWCSYAENNAHAWAMNRDARAAKAKLQVTGSKNPFSKLSESKVADIRSAYVPNMRGLRASLAEKYGVSIGTIKQVCARTSWRHI